MGKQEKTPNSSWKQSWEGFAGEALFCFVLFLVWGFFGCFLFCFVWAVGRSSSVGKSGEGLLGRRACAEVWKESFTVYRVNKNRGE